MNRCAYQAISLLKYQNLGFLILYYAVDKLVWFLLWLDLGQLATVIRSCIYRGGLPCLAVDLPYLCVELSVLHCSLCSLAIIIAFLTLLFCVIVDFYAFAIPYIAFFFEWDDRIIDHWIVDISVQASCFSCHPFLSLILIILVSFVFNSSCLPTFFP